MINLYCYEQTASFVPHAQGQVMPYPTSHLFTQLNAHEFHEVGEIRENKIVNFP